MGPGRNRRIALTAMFAILWSGAVVAQPADRFRASDDLLAYRSFGAGPSAIVLAGGPGSEPAYMEPVALALARTGRRAILLEPLGSGRSAARG